MVGSFSVLQVEKLIWSTFARDSQNFTTSDSCESIVFSDSFSALLLYLQDPCPVRLRSTSQPAPGDWQKYLALLRREVRTTGKTNSHSPIAIKTKKVTIVTNSFHDHESESWNIIIYDYWSHHHSSFEPCLSCIRFTSVIGFLGPPLSSSATASTSASIGRRTKQKLPFWLHRIRLDGSQYGLQSMLLTPSVLEKETTEYLLLLLLLCFSSPYLSIAALVKLTPWYQQIKCWWYLI